tara:strand:- start:726 stop:965 length:240 start_codon:yes stop_codon:yes gene_type:complete
MLGSNNREQSTMERYSSQGLLDPLTTWLIRIACISIIILFTAILLGLPILLSLVNSLIDNLLLNSKEFIRAFLETNLGL